LIQGVFREAHDMLQAEIKAVDAGAPNTMSPGYSMLRPVFGGDYSSFRVQRRWLQEIDRNQDSQSRRRGR
jgi:hypothetical protein